MALRILVYIGLLYQDLVKSKQLLENGRLPPVFPVVIYNGASRWQAPLEVADLIEAAPGGLANYRPRLRYLLLDEGSYAGKTLEPMENLVAALFRMENTQAPQELQRVVQLLIRWLYAPEQASLRRAFTVWIKRVLLPARMPGVNLPEMAELNEVNSILAERVKEWTDKSIFWDKL